MNWSLLVAVVAVLILMGVVIVLALAARKLRRELRRVLGQERPGPEQQPERQARTRSRPRRARRESASQHSFEILYSSSSRPTEGQPPALTDDDLDAMFEDEHQPRTAAPPPIPPMPEMPSLAPVFEALNRTLEQAFSRSGFRGSDLDLLREIERSGYLFDIPPGEERIVNLPDGRSIRVRRGGESTEAAPAPTSQEPTKEAKPKKQKPPRRTAWQRLLEDEEDPWAKKDEKKQT